MQVISSKTHGILDYVVSLILIASPWVLNFDRGGAETWIPVIIGVASTIMSIFTDYELGAVKKIPLAMHLNIDIVTGLFLALSPWLFGFSHYVFLPHLIFGLFEMGTALMTKRAPSYKYRTT